MNMEQNPTLKQLKDTVLKDITSWLSGVAEFKVSDNTVYISVGDIKSEWLLIPHAGPAKPPSPPPGAPSTPPSATENATEPAIPAPKSAAPMPSPKATAASPN